MASSQFNIRDNQENVTITRNTTNTTGGTFNCNKIGKQVFVNIYDMKMSSSAGNTSEWGSGFPKPITAQYVPLVSTDGSASLARLTTEGKLVNQYGAVSTTPFYYSQFSYISA